MKTSPELLTNILGVLGQISAKIDTIAAAPKSKGDTNVKIGGMLGVIGGKGAAAKVAEDVEKLKSAMKGLNLVRLNKLIISLKEYQVLSKKIPFSTKVSGWALAAQDISKALMFMGVGIISLIGAIALGKSVLGVSPYEVLGFIALTSLTLAASMMIISGGEAAGEKLAGGIDKGFVGDWKKIKSDKGRNKSAIQSAKDMGMALMFIAGGILSFGVSIVAAKVLLGAETVVGVGAQILLIIGMIGLSMVMLSLFTSGGDMLGFGKGKMKGKSKDAISNAKDMGIALMFISGGILAFAITMKLVPIIMGTGGNILKGMLVIGGIILGMAGLFVLLGLMGKGGLMKAGLATAGMLAGGMALMSLGVLAVAFASKILTSMGDKDATRTTKEGKEVKRGKFGQIMVGIGAGLGVFGLFMLSAIGLFWTLGLPVVSGPVLLGAAAIIGIAFSLILTTKAIKKVQETMVGLDAVKLKNNIKGMVSAVMAGVFEGVMGSGIDKPGEGSGELSLKELRQFRRVTKAIRMLGHVAKSLSKFAMGLKAFAKVGEVASLDYDVDGKPIIGEKLHVSQIASAIADTFGTFLKSLVDNTQNLTRKQARSLKTLGKALSGDKGIISGVNQFANTLNIFSKFGAEGAIYVTEYDDSGMPKKGKQEKVLLTTIVKHITDIFGTFVTSMVNNAKLFEPGGAIGNKMKKLGKALSGDKGILSAVSNFSNVLNTFAEFGAVGKIWIPYVDPKTGMIDEKKKEGILLTTITQHIVNTFGTFVGEMVKKAGLFESGGAIANKMLRFNEALMGKGKGFLRREKPGLLDALMAFNNILQLYSDAGADGKLPKKDPKTGEIIPNQWIYPKEVATNMVAGIDTFMSALNTAIAGKNISAVSKDIEKQLGSFTDVITQFDKLANSQEGMQKLASSMGLLATNVGLLVTNMGGLSTEKLQSLATITAQHAVTTKGVTISEPSKTTTTSAKTTPIDWNNVAEIIGNKVAEKLSGFGNGEFKFIFQDGPYGVVEMKSSK